MSLANRLTLVVAAVLAVLGTVAGVGVYEAVRYARQADLQQRNEARLTWLATSLELTGPVLHFNAHDELQGAAEYWEVTADDGRVLWVSEVKARRSSLLSSRVLVLGSPETPPTPGSTYTPCEPSVHPNANGDPQPNPTAYRLPDGSTGARLRLSARVSTHEMGEELERLAGVLWTVGVSALFLVGLALAFLIRWQLAPLSAMAHEASRIEPGAVGQIVSSGSALEYVRLRRALNQMLERMAGALERERSFASMAAHELRSPLAQLRTGLELTLRRDRPPAEYQAAMREALSDVARLEKLVGGLLQLTRLDRLKPAPTGDVPLAQVLRQAIRASGSAGPLGGLPPDAIRVEGDEWLLTIAVQNVLANAARYAPAAPPEWNCTVEAETVQVAISDSGPGVAAADRERIFEPLTRLEQARTIGEPSQGFGLGLAIARAAVQACHGKLLCQGRADAKPGAEFVFVLKRATSGTKAQDVSVPAAETSTGGGNA